MEIDANFISPEAAELDRIQCEYDVIFVVAGTNKKKNSDVNKIGAPADSLNSLVVNDVDFSGKSASYTRRGSVLSFFYKPDVCYYGGDGPDKIVVCEPLGKATVTGTSFAAPWITRKMAYLIHVMGLSRKGLRIFCIPGKMKLDLLCRKVLMSTKYTLTIFRCHKMGMHTLSLQKQRLLIFHKVTVTKALIIHRQRWTFTSEELRSRKGKQ